VALGNVLAPEPLGQEPLLPRVDVALKHTNDKIALFKLGLALRAIWYVVVRGGATPKSVFTTGNGEGPRIGVDRNAETAKRRNSESRPSLPRACLRPGCVGLGCRVLAERRRASPRGVARWVQAYRPRLVGSSRARRGWRLDATLGVRLRRHTEASARRRRPGFVAGRLALERVGRAEVDWRS
jgi:hypothetical protein